MLKQVEVASSTSQSQTPRPRAGLSWSSTSRGVASWCKIVESRVRMSCQWVHGTRGVRMRQTRRPLKPTTTGVWKPGFQQCS